MCLQSQSTVWPDPSLMTGYSIKEQQQSPGQEGAVTVDEDDISHRQKPASTRSDLAFHFLGFIPIFLFTHDFLFVIPLSTSQSLASQGPEKNIWDSCPVAPGVYIY